MPIAFECPKCKKEQRAQEHLKGRELKCAKCGGLFKVPAIGSPVLPGGPPARFVEELYTGPKKLPPKPAAPPAPVAKPVPPPAAKPLPAPAAALEQELILTDDMLVEESPTPSAKPPAQPAGKPVEEEVLLTEDMIVEEGAPTKPAGVEELDLIDEIIMEEAPPPAKPPKKK
jgi:hypothetical protein